MERVTVTELNGKVIRENDTYIVEDNNYLNNLVLSKTNLHPGHETSGHTHDDLEEVYFFQYAGKGTKMQINDEIQDIYCGDIVLIPAGAFHKVYNEGKEPTIFVCVFQKYERSD